MPGRDADLGFWIDHTTSVEEGRGAPKIRSIGNAETRVDRRTVPCHLHAPLTDFYSSKEVQVPRGTSAIHSGEKELRQRHPYG